MSLSRDQVLRLMAYADGELDEEDRAGVEALLASNDEARCVVAAMEGSAIGEWVRTAQEERAVAALEKLGGADSIADSVLAKIETPQQVVVDFASARARQQKQAGSRRTGAIVVGVLALAAGVALYIASERSKNPGVSVPVAVTNPPTQQAPTPQAPTAPTSTEQPSVTPPAAVAGAEQPPVEIESDSSDVSVYYVPTSPGAAANVNATSVVIWFDEPSGAK